MGHGSALQSSKPPLSSSLSGSSSHDCSQLYPKATAISFSFYEAAGNDSNDMNGKVLNASTSSAPKVSDVTGESTVQNWSPPIQVMEKPGDFNFNRISSTSDPPTRDSFSFETWSHNKGTNGTHSKLEGVLNASFRSDACASKTSDVTHESELQNESPTIQIMEMPGDFETNENPSSISMSKSTAWSNTSNGSLFSIDIGPHSIDIGPHSFSTDVIPMTDGDSYKSGELDTHEDLVRYRQMPLAPKGAEYNEETPANREGAGNTPRITSISVGPIKNGANQHAVPLRTGANASSHLVGTRPSNKSVDLQMTKKSEPTGCKCCCAGFTRDSCFCSSPSQCIISSGAWLRGRSCCCKWFSGLSFSCECLRCFCKQPKCKWCCSGWPSLNCCCFCKSITCPCSYFKCPSWKICHFRCSFCCGWNCFAKNSSIDNLAKDGGRITRVAA
ncbi:uncharacterized protein LOC115996584 isoform X1 [Ipomoea triloba]|uniref:uncharacterized protein LOC115996584 isoform X1 n=1 Tax=Ipomoea triloba TaxID=35885 RepID=UPI00125E389B|nr:uncharacterized protein LOC115996584 isoform X1 [Ipomoea triloba]XP_031091747.1 uncharacterized protein LOC115996584 isoform X1 [Ipomoea triloba]